jgi:hypothetical protein
MRLVIGETVTESLVFSADILEVVPRELIG